LRQQRRQDKAQIWHAGGGDEGLVETTAITETTAIMLIAAAVRDGAAWGVASSIEFLRKRE
jgi:hypothetical protein